MICFMRDIRVRNVADFISCAKPAQKNSYFKPLVLGEELGDLRIDGFFGGEVGFPVAALD